MHPEDVPGIRGALQYIRQAPKVEDLGNDELLREICDLAEPLKWLDQAFEAGLEVWPNETASRWHSLGGDCLAALAFPLAFAMPWISLGAGLFGLGHNFWGRRLKRKQDEAAARLRRNGGIINARREEAVAEMARRLVTSDVLAEEPGGLSRSSVG